MLTMRAILPGIKNEVVKMPDCYRKGKEQGLWYEIKTIEGVIRAKESAGMDTTKERELLTSFQGYARAAGYKSKALTSDYQFFSGGIKTVSMIESSTPDNSGLVGIMLHPGRPPKTVNESFSRMTAWRRKQKQGVIKP